VPVAVLRDHLATRIVQRLGTDSQVDAGVASNPDHTDVLPQFTALGHHDASEASRHAER
jgi:hypothetical protein